MKSKGCGFDEARLELVMQQIKEAGVDMHADITTVGNLSPNLDQIQRKSTSTNN